MHRCNSLGWIWVLLCWEIDHNESDPYTFLLGWKRVIHQNKNLFHKSVKYSHYYDRMLWKNSSFTPQKKKKESWHLLEQQPYLLEHIPILLLGRIIIRLRRAQPTSDGMVVPGPSSLPILIRRQHCSSSFSRFPPLMALHLQPPQLCVGRLRCIKLLSDTCHFLAALIRPHQRFMLCSSCTLG